MQPDMSFSLPQRAVTAAERMAGLRCGARSFLGRVGVFSLIDLRRAFGPAVSFAASCEQPAAPAFPRGSERSVGCSQVAAQGCHRSMPPSQLARRVRSAGTPFRSGPWWFSITRLTPPLRP
jgi:hypothetical protein